MMLIQYYYHLQSFCSSNCATFMYVDHLIPYNDKLWERLMAKMKKASMHIDIGISEDNRAKIVEGLSRLLADSYTLYLMTHNFHWNVTGPQFNKIGRASCRERV